LENIDIELNPHLHGPIVVGTNNPPGGVVQIPANVSEEIASEAGTRLVSKVGTSLTWDTRNSYLLPTKGPTLGVSGGTGGRPVRRGRGLLQARAATRPLYPRFHGRDISWN
jgi:hypothetical protein